MVFGKKAFHIAGNVKSNTNRNINKKEKAEITESQMHA